MKAGMKRLLERDPDETVPREVLEERKRVLERKKARLEQTLAVLETLEDEKASINSVDEEAKIMSHKDRRMLLAASMTRAGSRLVPTGRR
jgi:hypothetical protein